jgi:hypothetical protein
MIDGYAKTHLHDSLRWIREAMHSKLDGSPNTTSVAH